MWFLITALLLAAAFWQQPWTHLELPGLDAHAQEREASLDYHGLSRNEASDLHRLKYTAARADAVRRLEARRASEAAEAAALAASAAPSPRPVPYEGELRNLICSYSWPCAEALAIAFCESTMQPGATNGTSYGLFQINQIHAGRFPDFWTHWMDPAANTRWAYEIWSASGWHPWSCLPY